MAEACECAHTHKQQETDLEIYESKGILVLVKTLRKSLLKILAIGEQYSSN